MMRRWAVHSAFSGFGLGLVLATMVPAAAGAQTLNASAPSASTVPAASAASSTPVRPAVRSALRSQSSAPARIQWLLRVVSDGQEVDRFDGITTVGQSSTLTHSHDVSHPVGCQGASTPPVPLSRTVTVSPLGVDAQGVIGFDVTAEDQVSDTDPRITPSSNCALPPLTRNVNGRYPEMDVGAGQEVSWQLMKKDPDLQYRLSAKIVPAPSN